MFALIIGIDEYASEDIPSLKGAFADAQEFKTFLIETLRTPEDQITLLGNVNATRTALIEEFQQLATNPRIQDGEAVIIFYAGYGSQATVSRSGSSTTDEGTYVPVILPCDALSMSKGEVVAPIPDFTLHALLEDISRAKGRNVTFIFDSCYSVSQAQPLLGSSDYERSVTLPNGYYFQKDRNQPERSSSEQVPSYVTMSACCSSGQAWEHDGHGVFTTALLDVLRGETVTRLRYSDVTMLMEIDSRFSQRPSCTGYHADKFIFTTTPPSSAFTLFVPIRARLESKGPVEYILSGGSAHGLVIGDEFKIYPDMDYPKCDGTLAIVGLDAFYSILRPVSNVVPITRNSIAVRAKEGDGQSLRVYSHSGDEVRELLSSIQIENNGFPPVMVTSTPGGAHFVMSMQQDNLVIIEVTEVMTFKVSFRIKLSVKELGPILEASSRFFSELGLSPADSPLLEYLQIEIYKLPSESSAQKLLIQNVVPAGQDPIGLEYGSRYGLKLTNRSQHDLYPIAQVFHLNREFQRDTLYHPGCSQSDLGCPLRANHVLMTSYTFTGSPSCEPLEGDGHFAFLKVSFYSRPIDPLYDAPSLRSARHLPKGFKGIWASITKPLIYGASGVQSQPLEVQENHQGQYPLECQTTFVANSMPLLNSPFLRRDAEHLPANSKPRKHFNPFIGTVLSLSSSFRTKLRKIGHHYPHIAWRRVKRTIPRSCVSSR